MGRTIRCRFYWVRSRNAERTLDAHMQFEIAGTFKTARSSNDSPSKSSLIAAGALTQVGYNCAPYERLLCNSSRSE
jgi:hypothetical protein